LAASRHFLTRAISVKSNSHRVNVIAFNSVGMFYVRSVTASSCFIQALSIADATVVRAPRTPRRRVRECLPRAGLNRPRERAKRAARIAGAQRTDVKQERGDQGLRECRNVRAH
jgi:hypothetical protein